MKFDRLVKEINEKKDEYFGSTIKELRKDYNVISDNDILEKCYEKLLELINISISGNLEQLNPGDLKCLEK